MTRRRAKPRDSGHSEGLDQKIPVELRPQASPGRTLKRSPFQQPNKIEVGIKRPKTAPLLPLELLDQVFNHLEKTLNSQDRPWWETVVANNRLWVRLSLVSKDWYDVIKKYRSSLFLSSEKGAKRFLGRTRKAKLTIAKLHYAETMSDDTLAKLLPFVTGNLLALSIPLGMLQTKHMHALLKTGTNIITSVHVHGRPSDAYTGTWWKKAYILHDLPDLHELALTGLRVRGQFERFQAAVKSPIKKLRFDRIQFESEDCVGHLCWALVYHVDELHLRNIAVMYAEPMLQILSSVRTGLSVVTAENLQNNLPWSTEEEALKSVAKNVEFMSIDQLQGLAVFNGLNFQGSNYTRIEAFLEIRRYLASRSAMELPFLLPILFSWSRHPSEYMPKRLGIKSDITEDERARLLECCSVLNPEGPLPQIYEPDAAGPDLLEWF